MNLRFIERDGKKILQQMLFQEWIDVPLVEEPKKAREFWLVQNITEFSTSVYHTKDMAQSIADSCSGIVVHVREVLGGEK